MDLLAEPCGKQDQYIAAYGGLTCFDFHADGRVDVSALRIASDTLNELESHLLLFFTGYARRAATMLADQQQRSDAGDDAMLAALDETGISVAQIRDVLEAGDCEPSPG